MTWAFLEGWYHQLDMTILMSRVWQEVRVAVRWLNRENNQVSSVNTLSNNIFDRATKRGVPDIIMMTRTCRTLPLCVYTRTPSPGHMMWIMCWRSWRCRKPQSRSPNQMMVTKNSELLHKHFASRPPTSPNHISKISKWLLPPPLYNIYNIYNTRTLPNGKLNINVMSPGMMITATPGALQLSAKKTEHLAGQYDDLIWFIDFCYLFFIDLSSLKLL